MFDDIILNKTQIIERCIKRVEEEYADNPANLYNLTIQDSIILNLQRACEAGIALAMHIVAEKCLGVPQMSREAFDLLAHNNIIEEQLANRLKAMVGFRNIAVHDYQKIKLEIITKIIERNTDDLLKFTQDILKI